MVTLFQLFWNRLKEFTPKKKKRKKNKEKKKRELEKEQEQRRDIQSNYYWIKRVTRLDYKAPSDFEFVRCWGAKNGTVYGLNQLKDPGAAQDDEMWRGQS